jgi:hypothetical protein
LKHASLTTYLQTPIVKPNHATYMPTTRSQKREADMEAALKTFFSSPRFAVAGASSDPSKFGHKGNSPPTAAAQLYILAQNMP